MTDHEDYEQYLWSTLWFVCGVLFLLWLFGVIS